MNHIVISVANIYTWRTSFNLHLMIQILLSRNRKRLMYQKMKSSKVQYLLIPAMAVMMVGCKKEIKQAAPESIKHVKIEKVEGIDSLQTLSFNGKIQENSVTSLSFRVGGPIENITVEPGDYVKAGDVIATIDQRDYMIQLRDFEAQLEQTKAEYERYKEIYEDGKLPENTFDKIKSGYLRIEAATDNARNQLNDTKLISPVSGYVYEKYAENHQTTGVGNPVVSIVDVSKLEVVIAVPENQLNTIKQIDYGYLSVDNANIREKQVELSRVSEKSRQDGLYEVRFSFQNHDEYMVNPGMSADLSIQYSRNKSSQFVAASALFHQASDTFVWKYSPSKKVVSKCKVKVKNIVNDGQVEVISGISSGDMIVTAGVHNISDGQKVKPIEEASSTNIGGLL